MKKTILGMTALCALVATSAFAGQKFTANVGTMAVVNPLAAAATGGWSNVMNGSIHMAQQQDLLIGVSLQTSLLTDTLVSSKGGAKDTSTAKTGITIRVLVDGKEEASPGEVIYDQRTQQLTATLGGYYTNCVDANGDGIIDVTKECELAPEQVGLLLDTTAAHHFNFVKANLGAGDHTIQVQAKIDNATAFTNGTATATALLGKGSLTIETVSASNAPDGIVLQ